MSDQVEDPGATIAVEDKEPIVESTEQNKVEQSNDQTSNGANEETKDEDTKDEVSKNKVKDESNPQEEKVEKKITDASKSNSKSKKNQSEPAEPVSFNPGMVVLAKLKGFPAWPAMILDETNLPPNVLGVKPKSSSSKNRRKSGPADDGMLWPVRFFIDNNHMWASRSELKVLSSNEAQEYVDNPKSKRDKTLVEAYRMAVEPPSLEDFVNPKVEEIVAEEEEEEEEGFDEEGDVDMEKPKKKRAAPKKAKAEPKSKSKSKSVKKEPAKKRSGAKQPDETPAKKAKAENGPSKKRESKTPSAKQIAKEYSERHDLAYVARHRLQRGFLGKDLDEKGMVQMSQQLKVLEALPDLEVSILRQTRIKKVLKAILKLETNDEFKKHDIHNRCYKILEMWGESAVDDVPKNEEEGEDKKFPDEEEEPHGKTGEHELLAKDERTEPVQPEPSEAEGPKEEVQQPAIEA